MPNRKRTRAWVPGPLVLAAVVGTAMIALSEMRLNAESVSVSTYYSAPRGMYEELQVFRDARLADDAAAQVLIGAAPAPIPADKVVVDGNVEAQRFVGPRIVPVGAVAIFRGGCPAGWVRVGAFDNRAIRGAGAYGATFDAVLTHTHVLAHAHTTDDPVPDISGVAGDHGHTVTGA